MPKQIAISVRHDHTLIGLFENEKLVDIFLDRPDQESAVGNIFVGKVTRVLDSLQSAFVDIGVGKDAFLPGSEAYQGERPRGRGSNKPLQERLKSGGLVPIQVEKDEIADKGKKITMDLSLPGRYFVYLPFHRKLNISKRIQEKQERDRLKEVVQEVAGAEQGGWIVRTNAEGNAKKELQKDLRDLVKTWRTVSAAIEAAKSPSLVHIELTPIEQVLRDHYTKDTNRVLVDNLRVKQHVDRFIRSLLPPRLIPRRIAEYIEPDVLMETFSFKKELQRTLEHKVRLNCGGYLIIEETETLTAIDVNTGRNVGGKDVAKTIVTTNLEAAEEIGRQLRLRGIGGIIVIDFIDMRSEKDNQRVIQMLQRALSGDRAAFDITQFSDIGLVQVTRKRTGESLSQLLSVECPHCGGNGRILTIRGA
jgi:ribonuclease G